MAYDEALAERVRAVRRARRGVTERWPKVLKSAAELKRWIELCAEFAATLPAKVGK